MKRTFGILAGVVGVGGLFYLGSQLWAQAPYTPPPAAPAAMQVAPPQTRIAIINFNTVMKNYKKFAAVQAEMAAKQSQYKAQFEAYAKDMENKQKLIADPKTTGAQRDQLTKDLKDIQRKGQDLEEDAKKVMSELQATRMTQMYKEIEDAVAAHAKPRGIELVLQYGDGTDADKYLPAFIQRRVTNGACMPIYNVPGMDITVPVYTLLNHAGMTQVNPSSIPPAPGSR